MANSLLGCRQNFNVRMRFQVNGKLTQGENIADNGGVKESFRAYKKYVRTHGEEPRLPGLSKYSNEQIFFLSYAHFWCGQKKQAAAMQQVLTDEHSPEVVFFLDTIYFSKYFLLYSISLKSIFASLHFLDSSFSS